MNPSAVSHNWPHCVENDRSSLAICASERDRAWCAVLSRLSSRDTSRRFAASSRSVLSRRIVSASPTTCASNGRLFKRSICWRRSCTSLSASCSSACCATFISTASELVPSVSANLCSKKDRSRAAVAVRAVASACSSFSFATASDTRCNSDMSSRAACSSGSLIAMRSACKEDTMALEAVAAYAPGRRDAALAVEANAIAATAASRAARRRDMKTRT
mmetsp:Transcript_27536/g.83769  ORF Transcript_27536/g.83769 Transcript_27536/m.83769 type:complete len:218 (+) Transcript_27536:5556-6209(+)